MKILILSNLYSMDLKQDFDILDKTLNKNKYAFVSPLTIMDDSYGVKSQEYFFDTLLKTSLNISEVFNDFFAVAAKSTNKGIIYFSYAAKLASFDLIIAINKNLLQTQESFIYTYYPYFANSYYTTEDAGLFFNSIEEAVEYINGI